MSNKKIKILFSIPVHEQLDVVIDQVINFVTMNDECAVVLHLSPSFNLSDDELTFLRNTCESIGNVFINPKRVKTETSSIIQAHLSNFECVENLNFEYFALSASNELFIRKGLYSYIKQFDCIMYQHKTPIDNKPENEPWFQMKKALLDRALIEKVIKHGGRHIYGGQIEGSYYKKDIFRLIANEINSFFDPRHISIRYAREELYFHTFCALLDKDDNLIKGAHYTYINWNSEPFLTINKRDIRRSNKSDNYYSVKRIKRELNDYLRIYLRNKNKYFNIEKKYLFNRVLSKEKPKAKVLRIRESLGAFFARIGRIVRYKPNVFFSKLKGRIIKENRSNWHP